MLEISIKNETKKEKRSEKRRLTPDERKLNKFWHTGQKPDKDWDLKNKRRVCLSLSREVDTKLRLLVKSDVTIRDKSNAVERILWQYFNDNSKEIIIQLEDAEHKLDFWRRKTEQMQRRKQIVEALSAGGNNANNY